MQPFHVPSLYIKRRDEQTTTVSLKLTRARDRIVVRLTGGCGHMSAADTAHLDETFVDAFQGFGGVILFGGTRMVNRNDPSKIVSGITELAPLIRAACDTSVILGIVPRVDELQLREYGLVIENDSRQEFVTIVHPQQDMCLVVQQSADQCEIWDAEYQECIRITESLRDFAGWQSLLIAYNGGTVTRREICVTAERGWPVLLIAGSGRTCDKLCNDKEFLLAHPNVTIAENNATSIRQQLLAHGALPA